MGRLFWKFLLFIWLAQMVGMVGIGAMFWLERHEAQQSQGRFAPDGPPPGDFRGSPPDELRGPPPPQSGETPFRHPPDVRDDNRPPPPPLENHRRHGFIPLEPLIGNMLVTLLCAILLAWYCSKPIRTLRKAFDTLAEGDLNVRLGPIMGKRRGELADLSDDFDRMASQLQALMNSQRHLLHDVSHELRSPLARLQASIGLARQNPEKLAATLDRIELESTRIDQLVGELLTLSRLEAGVMGDLNDDIGMDELLADLVEDARFEAELRGCEVEFRGESDVIVKGRAELLYRAIENVVRNAVKYTANDSIVTLRAEYDAHLQRLKLFVLDKGPGIPEAELGKIFEPFFRSPGSAKSDGYGLGLAIAQRAIEAHGGRVVASNRASGGLCVEIDLPARKPSLPAFTST